MTAMSLNMTGLQKFKFCDVLKILKFYKAYNI